MKVSVLLIYRRNLEYLSCDFLKERTENKVYGYADKEVDCKSCEPYLHEHRIVNAHVLCYEECAKDRGKADVTDKSFYKVVEKLLLCRVYLKLSCCTFREVFH